MKSVKFIAASCFAAAVFLTGCAFSYSRPGAIPKSPEDLWLPGDAPESVPLSDRAGFAAEEISAHKTFSLGELISLALRHNPRTKASWLRARAQYAGLASEYGGYFPDAAAGWGYTKQRQPSGTSAGARTDKGPYLTVHYLLFDFGKREAQVREARSLLAAVNFEHNEAVQRVIYEVQQAYYTYAALRALRLSQMAALDESRLNLEAAEDKQRAGLVTVADVLQARTEYSRAKLALETTEGQILAVRGTVLTAAGLLPTTAMDIEDVPLTDLPVAEVREDVEALLERSQKSSPRLAAARMRAAGLHNRAEAVRREQFPALSLSGDWQALRDSGETDEAYLSGIRIEMPLFDGFSRQFQAENARLAAQAADQDYRQEEQEQALRVWVDYSLYKTALQQAATSEDVLRSAEQSYQVSLGRYKEGVGGILDLLASQQAFQEARALQVRAKADLLLSLSRLYYDLGSLAEPRENGAAAPAAAPAGPGRSKEQR